MEENNIIEIKNLSVFAGKNQILHNVSTNIEKGKITVLMGPSGCGKTTLLKTLNRLTDLYDLKAEGEILFHEKNILATSGYELVQLRQKMGLLSQRPFPLPVSIYENIACAVRLKGVKNKGEIGGQVEHYLKMTGIFDEVKDRLHSSPNSLSIGQQQRICLARGLAVDPEVILADEPTSALDPISTQAIEKAFFELKENYTIILVSHILRQVKRMADDVNFMYLGKLVESGNATTVFSNPKEEITKKYLEGVFY